MQVISAKLLTRFLTILNFKKLVEISLRNPSRAKKLLVSKHLYQTFDVNEFLIMDKSVVTLSPKGMVSTVHILFFHGGGYVLEGTSMHWNILEKIVLKANCKVSYFDYPLAPEYNYKTTFEMVQQCYDKLLYENPNDRFMLMGDSAGGGLALAFAQKLAAENALIQPSKIILFSPWLDMAMENSEIMKMENLDKILSVNALRDASKHYSGVDNLHQYLLSPINGNLEGLGETLVFYGTHEILFPDCLKLKDKTAGLENFHFREFTGMQHDWVLFPIPEADEALEMAIEFIVR
jgi:acetyl esterase/lipase